MNHRHNDRRVIQPNLPPVGSAGLVLLSLIALSACGSTTEPAAVRRPNILFAISDDQSFPHAGAYGDPNVSTPAFDRVAREGVLFTHSYTAAPSCTPSRGAILSGQAIWRLGEAGVLMGTYPPDLVSFPRMLEEAGYRIGYTGKAWGPGDWKAAGLTEYPVGEGFNDRKYESAPSGIRNNDYAANFEDFLAQRNPEDPFFFWYGAGEPHRRYDKGAGLRNGKTTESVSVPPFLPDTEEIRSDILDYYVEIEWFDSHLGRMLDALEKAGELDNTLIVVTSDNGMPFPRAKTTLYDWGTRMPLAIRWPGKIPGGRTIDDFVSHADFAPTFLEAAGLRVPKVMTGRSLHSLLTGNKQGRVDPARDRVFTAIERHTWTRPNGAPYPVRAIRTAEFLYIRNFEPARWPAGDPDIEGAAQGQYGDVDRCPTKTFMLEAPNRKKYAREFKLAFGRRPAEELYRVASDPGQIDNLAADPQFAAIKKDLTQALAKHLAATGDPRSRGESPWDLYPYRRSGNPRVPRAVKPVRPPSPGNPQAAKAW